MNRSAVEKGCLVLKYLVQIEQRGAFVVFSCNTWRANLLLELVAAIDRLGPGVSVGLFMYAQCSVLSLDLGVRMQFM